MGLLLGLEELLGLRPPIAPLLVRRQARLLVPIPALFPGRGPIAFELGLERGERPPRHLKRFLEPGLHRLHRLDALPDLLDRLVDLLLQLLLLLLLLRLLLLLLLLGRQPPLLLLRLLLLLLLLQLRLPLPLLLLLLLLLLQLRLLPRLHHRRL